MKSVASTTGSNATCANENLIGADETEQRQRPTHHIRYDAMNAPYTSLLKDAALNQNNLVTYVDRINARWFSDDPMSLNREQSSQ